MFIINFGRITSKKKHTVKMLLKYRQMLYYILNIIHYSLLEPVLEPFMNIKCRICWIHEFLKCRKYF